MLLTKLLAHEAVTEVAPSGGISEVHQAILDSVGTVEAARKMQKVGVIGGSVDRWLRI